MSRPRPYLSFSQMTTFEMSPERYANQYIYGEKKRITRNIALGSQLAKGLEEDEASGDPLLDLVMAKIPKLALRDEPVEYKLGEFADPKLTATVWFERDKRNIRVPVLKNNGDDIPLLAVPDTAEVDWSAFKEYKSSTRKWTQKMVDESGQITFYATTIWLKTGKIPNDIELVWAETAYDADGRLYATGKVVSVRTHRHMTEIIKMTGRMRKAWAGIKTLSEKELL